MAARRALSAQVRASLSKARHCQAVDWPQAARGSESARTAGRDCRSRPVARGFGALVLRDQGMVGWPTTARQATATPILTIRVAAHL
jgi:hypothetical protein